MSNVAILDKRAACRICGSRSHVTTVANPRSPRLGCCASCGTAAAALLDWYKQHSDVGLERLIIVVREKRAASAPESKPIERAV
jgi:transcription elongation factor Elf1